ncbi:MAG: hypothetical protein HC906_06140 [Bacteroidales bacterium]|nr:hypothetical protein [Bacteroidales bacterium]
MKHLVTGCLLLFYFLSVFAQVVTSEPVFFSENDPVTVLFHADEGTAGLKDYAGDVYAHTGVITAEDGNWDYVIAGWSENTEKAKLVKVSANTYKLEISPSVREFYNVPLGVTIHQLAFVFRNSDGSKQGKDTDDKDVFISLSTEGPALKINSPLRNQLFNQGEPVHIHVSAFQSDSLKLYVNDIPVAGNNEQSISFSFDTTLSKLYTIKAKMKNSDTIISDSVKVFVTGNIPQQTLPAGSRKGIHYTGETSARLVLFAPLKKPFLFWVILTDGIWLKIR